MSLRQLFSKAHNAIDEARECARVVFAGLGMPEDEDLGDEADVRHVQGFAAPARDTGEQRP